MDYYNILGVESTANNIAIKSAYKKKVKQTHPDVGGKVEEFKQVNEAYNVLKNPQKRAEYDHFRSGAGRIHVNINGQPHDIFSEVFNDLRNVFGDDGPFTHPRAYRRQVKNKDLNVNIAIKLADLLKNQHKTISVRHLTGDRKIIQITIPRGIQPGTHILYTGLGDNSIQELPPGDLYVNITIEDHPRFIIDNFNLLTSVTIDCFDAITGTVVTVKSLEEKKLNLTIFPGTQYGTIYNLNDQGLPIHNTNQRGKLQIRVLIKIPDNITQKQLNIIKSFKGVNIETQ